PPRQRSTLSLHDALPIYVGPLAVRQAFAAAPKPTRRDSQTPRPALAGQQRQHRRIHRDEVRPPSVELVDQLAQRLEYREGPGDGDRKSTRLNSSHVKISS